MDMKPVLSIKLCASCEPNPQILGCDPMQHAGSGVLIEALCFVWPTPLARQGATCLQSGGTNPVEPAGTSDESMENATGCTIDVHFFGVFPRSSKFFFFQIDQIELLQQKSFQFGWAHASDDPPTGWSPGIAADQLEPILEDAVKDPFLKSQVRNCSSCLV